MEERVNDLDQDFLKVDRKLRRIRLFLKAQNIIAAIMVGYSIASTIRYRYELGFFIMNLLALCLWAFNLYKSNESLKENVKITNNIRASQQIINNLKEVVNEMEKKS